MSLVFWLVFQSPKWFTTRDPVALFWKNEDFNEWVEKIQDIHEAYDVYEIRRKEDGTLEILRRL
jgi:hypothetical protein